MFADSSKQLVLALIAEWIDLDTLLSASKFDYFYPVQCCYHSNVRDAAPCHYRASEETRPTDILFGEHRP